ncbi:zinc finger protein 500-like, partial [Alligator sinensis]|uniref:Zinc finger protein 500-like n=1 Tax=Alligator sinensis TaxID=38654 RepID=A0A1U7SZ36_ALLSI
MLCWSLWQLWAFPAQPEVQVKEQEPGDLQARAEGAEQIPFVVQTGTRVTRVSPRWSAPWPVKQEEPVQRQEIQGQEVMQAMRPPPETKIPLETPQLGYDLPTPETWRQRFRGFCYMETMGPQEVCSRLWEFALRWLDPQRRSKEQMLELVVLEQLLAILPREMQSWQWGHGVETCAEAVTLAEGFKLGQEEEEKLQVIVSVKVHQCSECGKRFTQFFSLARHQFIH